MARVKNVIEKADSMIGKIPAGYTLSAAQIKELYAESPDWFHLVANCFRFGFLLGMKATKAKNKKSVVKEKAA